jgi:hypothetical protein
MSVSQKLAFASKAVAQLGAQQVGNYMLYQLALKSGVYRLLTPARVAQRRAGGLSMMIKLDSPPLPAQVDLQAAIGEDASILIAEARDIARGKVRLFGGPLVELELAPAGRLRHWTSHADVGNLSGGSDIKFTWEPARFGWACILARAYRFSEDETFTDAFWQHTERFLDANPTNRGPNWASAQEVAIRLIALAFAFHVFSNADGTTPERRARLAQAIADHAARIPPTLAYARSQHNNHLLTEAAALCTAARCLSEHGAARRWWVLGWSILNAGLQSQIEADGTYTQHSVNYHRLMLQVALWGTALGETYPNETRIRLAAATRWLLALTDPPSGRAPNLGHNDGSNILPLSVSTYQDYRPVLQAAGRAFLSAPLFPPGPWDELAIWLGLHGKSKREEVLGEPTDLLPPISSASNGFSPIIFWSPRNHSWAFLHTAKYISRPAHADQLHLDLWWRGYNLAQDSGTYLYNSKPPWENSLAHTSIHNTLEVGNRDQMTWAGRFLWLDWAQSRVINIECDQNDHPQRVIAEHDGYHRLGVTHRRTVSVQLDGNWLVEDLLLPWQKGAPFSPSIPSRGDRISRSYDLRLHWQLPDWPWEIGEIGLENRGILNLRSPHGWVQLRIGVVPHPSDVSQPLLVRAGEVLSGTGLEAPTWGWVSPTYGQKIPALSYSLNLRTPLPVTFISHWLLPE